jgi:hypothetical protein
MPYEIAIVNPRKVKKMAKRKKGKMPAGLRRYWAAKRAGKVSNPRKKTRRHHARKAVHHKKRRVSNPRHVARRRSHRRYNPRFNIGGLKALAMPAVLGAGGALAMDIALGYLPLPVALQTGMPKQGVRIVTALGVGWAASKVLGKAKGHAFMQGALTIIAYDVLKGLIHQYAPTVPGLAGDYEEVALGYINPAPLLQNAGTGAYMNDMGAYLDPVETMGDF